MKFCYISKRWIFAAYQPISWKLDLNYIWPLLYVISIFHMLIKHHLPMLIRILGLHAALRASSVKDFYVNLYVILWLVFHFLFRKFKSKLQKRKKKKVSKWFIACRMCLVKMLECVLVKMHWKYFRHQVVACKVWNEYKQKG